MSSLIEEHEKELDNKKLFLNVCSKAVQKWGHIEQSFTACEEMGELIQALSKRMRGEQNHENIVEELADVTIMIQQLKLIHGIDEREFQAWLLHKVRKLGARLSDV